MILNMILFLGLTTSVRYATIIGKKTASFLLMATRDKQAVVQVPCQKNNSGQYIFQYNISALARRSMIQKI